MPPPHYYHSTTKKGKGSLAGIPLRRFAGKRRTGACAVNDG